MNPLHPANIVMPSEPGQSPRLLGGSCGECNTVIFPTMPVCPKCGSNGKMQPVEIGEKGRLYSHTIARFAPKGFKAPFFQAFIDLEEGPRIFSLIGSQCPVESGVLEDGMDMRIVLEPLADTPENKHVLTYKYVPASAEKRDA